MPPRVVAGFRRAAVSVPEVADAGEDHGEAEAVGGGDDFGVADGAAGLDDGGDATDGGGAGWLASLSLNRHSFL
jgi:hypothetical protein